MHAIETQRSILRLTASTAVGLLPLFLPWGSALAQSTNGVLPRVSSSRNIEEIIVTARKHSESIQRVPLAVTAVTGDQLKERSIKTVENLQSIVPGLFVQQDVSDSQSIALTMRGRKQDFASTAVEASVGISIDGLYVPHTLGMTASMLDINRVEVLRGPQGTLYGRNTTGGVIGIFTNDPKHELSGSVDMTVGDYGTWNAVGTINVPVTENLDARFVAQRGGNGGYEHTTSGTPLGSTSSEYYRGKFHWSTGDNWQIMLSGHFERGRSGGARTFFPTLNPANFQGNGLPEGSYLNLAVQSELGVSATEATNLLKSWTAEKSPWYTLDNSHGPEHVSKSKRWDVGFDVHGDLTQNVEIRSITGVQHLSRDVSGGPQAPIFILKDGRKSIGTYYSQEFQLLGKTSRFDWTVGLYGGYESNTESASLYPLPAVFGTTSVNIEGDNVRNTTLAVYAQATWEFIPKWHLTGGARYTSDERRIGANSYYSNFLNPAVHVCVVPAPGADLTPPGASQCPRLFKASFTKPTWLASLDHQLTRNILVYAKAATGYRSGGLRALSGAYNIDTFESYRPETNLEYELGLKSDLFDQRVRLNVASYTDDYTNLQVPTTNFGPDGVIRSLQTNAAKARIRGVEAEADVIVSERLRFHASGAYADAKYLKYIDLFGDHSQQPFSIPKWTYTLSSNYVHSTNIGYMSIEVDYAWKSSVNTAPTSTFVSAVTQSAYGLLNARVGLHVNALDLDISIFGQNLTNKSYFDQGFSLQLPGFDFSQVYVGGPPRIFGAQLVKKFG